MENVIVIGVLLIVVGIAVCYMWKEKKRGARCIGCPEGGCYQSKVCGNKETNCKCHSGNR